MWFFWMVYSLEDTIVICGRFPATTNRIVCIARGIEGHAWQGPTHCWDKKNGKDYVHWMMSAMHRSCTTAYYNNSVKEIVMMATSFLMCNHINLLCTRDSSWSWQGYIGQFCWCCVIFLDNLDSCILLVLHICMRMKCIHVSKSLWGWTVEFPLIFAWLSCLLLWDKLLRYTYNISLCWTLFFWFKNFITN